MVLIPIHRPTLDYNGNVEQFLKLYSNYSYGDRINNPMRKIYMTMGKGVQGGIAGCITGGVSGGVTALEIKPVGDVGAQLDIPATNIDLLQNQSEYRANSEIMKEIYQKTIRDTDTSLQQKTPQVELATKKQKIGREIGKKKRDQKSEMLSSQTIVNDYNRLNTLAKKKKFIRSLASIYKRDPANSKYITDGLALIKSQ